MKEYRQIFTGNQTWGHHGDIVPQQVAFTRPTDPGSLIDGQPARIVWDILTNGPQPAAAS